MGSLCYKVITAAADAQPDYAAAGTACAALGTDAKLAAPTNKDIMAAINTQNTAAAQLWLGLDDRLESKLTDCCAQRHRGDLHLL